MAANNIMHMSTAFRVFRCSGAVPVRPPPQRRQHTKCNSTPKWKRTSQSMPGEDPDDSSTLQPGETSFGTGAGTGGPVYRSRSSQSQASDSTGQSPDEVAKEQRERAAEAAAGNVEDAGQRLGSSIGQGIRSTESALADGQDRFAGAAARAAGDVQTDQASSFNQMAAEASEAARDTRTGRQDDARRAEGAVSRQTDQVSSAVADGIKNVPTAADAVRGVGDGAVGALKGLSQAGSQVSDAAESFQKGADSLASDVQRNTERGSQKIQDRVNKVSAKVETTARDLKDGTTKMRGKPLLSESTPLTSFSASGRDDIDGLKTELLASVAGLDRGFAAGKTQVKAVQDVVDKLVAASEPVNLMPQSSGMYGTAVTTTDATFVAAPPGSTPGSTSVAVSPRGAATPGAGFGSSSAAPPSTGSSPVMPPRLTTLPGSSTESMSTPFSTPSGPTSPLTTRPGASTTVTPSSSSSPEGFFDDTPVAPTQPGLGAFDRPTGSMSSNMPQSQFAAGRTAYGSEIDTDKGQNNELGGLWRLVYSSGFARRNTGGARPGIPISLFPAQFGQIYQDINTTTRKLDNVVELRRPALPVPSWAPIKPLPAEALLTLKHRMEISAPATVTITFSGTDVNLQGGLGGILNSVPQFELPNLPEQLQPPRKSRSASFEVIYLDDDIRITKGDRKEIRVFLRT